jgi:sulfoxide reductase heme-binding subunit YedZ
MYSFLSSLALWGYTRPNMKLSKLLLNTRFYILVTSLLLSIFVAAFARYQIPSDQLYYIRSEQIFGLVSILLLYIAVIITPASKLVGKKPWMDKLLFARRAIGVSSAYFAILHVYLVLTQQTGGLSGLKLLPVRFQLAFLLGTIALIILFLMAITSFDKAMDFMTFKRWKRLHRFVYIAGVVLIVHVWLIGTHIEQNTIKVIAFLLLALLFGLEARRIASKLAVTRTWKSRKKNIVFVVLFVAMIIAILLLPKLTKNYHSQHHHTASIGSPYGQMA